MKPLGKTLIAGAALIAALGVAGIAAAELKNAHVLTVRLPDGSVERIHYIGDTPPRVSIQGGPADLVAFAPFADPFGPGSPFAEMQRMSAAMDQQAAMMMQQARMMSPSAADAPDGLSQADWSRMPAGMHSVSVVSTLTGSGLCTRTVQYTSRGAGAAPQVITKTSGACGASTQHDAAPAAPVVRAGPASPGADHLVQTAYHGATPVAGQHLAP